MEDVLGIAVLWMDWVPDAAAEVVEVLVSVAAPSAERGFDVERRADRRRDILNMKTCGKIIGEIMDCIVLSAAPGL
jgi:hypothetical protein